MKNKSVQYKPDDYMRMTTEELAEATAEFDREFVADEFEPLTPEQQARWERAMRKGARGKGEAGGSNDLEHVTVGMDRDLLRRADEVAQRLGATRDDVFARGLRAVLAVEGE